MDNKTKLFETERLILRRFELSDAEDMFKNYCSSENVARYVKWSAHKSIDDTRAYLEDVALPRYDEGCYQWAIVLKETNEVVGCIDVCETANNNTSAMLGWCLSEKLWGQGLMPEAGKVVRDYLFDEGFVRVWAKHHTANPKSGRVMAKLGMTHEGVLRKSEFDNKGNLVDCDYWAIIKE